MLSRAVRHADAVVVPTHAMAAQLAEIAPLGARIRVIAGAPVTGFGVPANAPDRVRRTGVASPYIVAFGSKADPEEFTAVFERAALLDVDVVVFGEGGTNDSSIIDRALASGLIPHRVHAIARVSSSDRAALFAGALAVVSISTAPVYPWRLLEALATGAPIIAGATTQNEELLADAAHFVDPRDSDALGAALSVVVENEGIARRLRVLSEDRSRAFTWSDSARRVWQLHADL
jgi:glycosyltransferase involved in cell wall biosynthesis